MYKNKVNKLVIFIDIFKISKTLMDKDPYLIITYVYKYIRNTLPHVIISELTIDKYYFYLNDRKVVLNELSEKMMDEKLRDVWNYIFHNESFVKDDSPLLAIDVLTDFNGIPVYLVLTFYTNKE